MTPLGRVPTPPLSQSVQVLWYAEAWKPPHRRERHMPDGSASLILLLDGALTTEQAAFVTGPRSRSVLLDTSRPQTVIGAQIVPGGIARLLGVPSSALTNSTAALHELVGLAAGALTERLLTITEAERRLDLLEEWLLGRMMRHKPPEPAIHWAVRQLQQRPHVRIRDLTAQIGRSSRWFAQRFADEVGLAPKLFGRMQRFQGALRAAHARPHVALAELAIESGYFDQAHLTHDFQDIAGLTPSAYLARRTEHRNHVADE